MKAAPLVILLMFAVIDIAAQGIVELRVADTHYRFVDVSFSGKSGAAFDCFYVGVPESNELNVGGGYTFKRDALMLTPLIYAVVGKEGGQRGIKTALLTSFEKNRWKFTSFLAAFTRTSGSAGSYQVLDTADLTRMIATRWEIGAQAGFFRSEGAWNMQIGPLVKRDDARGAWAVSYRFGNQKEFRVGRVWVF